MRKSGRWLFRLDLFFLAFSQYSVENTGQAPFSEDNGGKSHSENTGQQLQGSESLRTLCHRPGMSPSSPVTVANRQGEAGKEV